MCFGLGDGALELLDVHGDGLVEDKWSHDDGEQSVCANGRASRVGNDTVLARRRLCIVTAGLVILVNGVLNDG